MSTWMILRIGRTSPPVSRLSSAFSAAGSKPVVLFPHAAHPRADINPDLACRDLRRRPCHDRPTLAFKQRQQSRRDEARSRGIDMTVAIGGLAVGIESL